LPKFVHRKYASLVNIDVGTLLQIAQQKNAKTMKKIFKKKIIPDLPTLIFSRYETGTTVIFFLRLSFCVLTSRSASQSFVNEKLAYKMFL
jgi:hypothetical protein